MSTARSRRKTAALSTAYRQQFRKSCRKPTRSGRMRPRRESLEREKPMCRGSGSMRLSTSPPTVTAIACGVEQEPEGRKMSTRSPPVWIATTCLSQIWAGGRTCATSRPASCRGSRRPRRSSSSRRSRRRRSRCSGVALRAEGSALCHRSSGSNRERRHPRPPPPQPRRRRHRSLYGPPRNLSPASRRPRSSEPCAWPPGVDTFSWFDAWSVRTRTSRRRLHVRRWRWQRRGITRRLHATSSSRGRMPWPSAPRGCPSTSRPAARGSTSWPGSCSGWCRWKTCGATRRRLRRRYIRQGRRRRRRWRAAPGGR
mmetsp:Transcript_150273/g.482899  ORF Transcript_150273/g.482899 Transcript_150273/m.482899 type:complete len:312 (+) Transcript_150273:1603-2538(+)